MAAEVSASVKKITLKEEAAAATEGSSSQASEVAATEGSSSQASEVAATEGSSSQASEVVATELSASEESATEVPALVKKITLISSDGVEFVIDENVAMESQMIKLMIEDDCAESSIPLPNVNSMILTKVIEYSKKHVESPTKAIAEMAADKAAIEELKKWDAEFVKVDQGTLFQMILAANYLDIKGLLELTCEKVADMMRGKTPEEIRTLFRITNDYTPEEEEEVRRANQWAFE